MFGAYNCAGAECCPSGIELLELSEQADLWSGSGGSGDCVAGLDGDDQLSGKNGGDVLLGGTGQDTLVGGNGEDWLDGGTNDDQLDSGNGPDVVIGGGGNDIIAAGKGDDTVFPGGGSDTVDTGIGDDVVVFTSLCELEGTQVVDGGNGTDTLYLPDELVDVPNNLQLTSIEHVLPLSGFGGSLPSSVCEICDCQSSGGSVECCSGNGQCASSDPDRPEQTLCRCEPGWMGSACEISTPAVLPAITVPTPADGDPIWDGLPIDPGTPSDPGDLWWDDATIDSDVASQHCADLDMLAEMNDGAGPNYDIRIACPGESGCGGSEQWPLLLFSPARNSQQQWENYRFLQEYLAFAGVASAVLDIEGLNKKPKAQALVCANRYLHSDYEFAGGFSDRFMFSGHSSGGFAAGWAAKLNAELANSATDGLDLRGVVSIATNAYKLAEFQLFKDELSNPDWGVDGVMNAGTGTDSDPSTRWFHFENWDVVGAESSTFGTFSPVNVAMGLHSLPGDGCNVGSHYHWGGRACAGAPGGGSPTGQTATRAVVGGFARWMMRGDDALRPFFTGAELEQLENQLTEVAGPLRRQYREGSFGGGRRLTIDAFEGLATSSPRTCWPTVLNAFENERGGLATCAGFDQAVVRAVDDPLVVELGEDANFTDALHLTWTTPGATLQEPIPVSPDLSSFGFISFRLAQPISGTLPDCVNEAPAPQDVTVRLEEGEDQYEVTVTAFDEPKPHMFGPVSALDCGGRIVFETFRLPLSGFCDQGFDPAGLTRVSFLFGGETGDVILDNIEFSGSDYDDASSFCDDGSSGTGTGGGDECPIGDPGCPGGECLATQSDLDRLENHPGMAAYFQDQKYCSDPRYICREDAPGVFTCHDCDAEGDSGWGCPCSDETGCDLYPPPQNLGVPMECRALAAPSADPHVYPYGPKPGACFPYAIDILGFCDQNCEAQQRVCGPVIDSTLPDICVAEECFPPCETGTVSTPVCDRDWVQIENQCIAPCASDESCGTGLICTDWGECVGSSP